ncbi:hypothetical protein HOD38_03520 [archaeon]|mgnify:FL=1|jgi:hypothetical protein|nr:hypothetical protein [archaeon]MBT4397310.1 hypothetical protein [archaeon]MBT4440690.1 hypothetical protein [archaeon]
MDYELELLIQSRYDRDKSSRTVIGLGTMPQELPPQLAEWKGHHVTLEVRYPIVLNGQEWVLGHMVITGSLTEGEGTTKREDIGLKLSTDSLTNINASRANMRLPLEYSVR